MTAVHPTEARLWRFLLGHLAAGVAASVVTSTAILVLDVGHLGTLIGASDEPVVPLILLYGSLAIAFGGAAMGVGIFGRGGDES